jgi:integrase
MASIAKVSTGWRARYRAPDGASRSRTFGRKVDAERFLVTVEASKLTGAYVDPSAGRLTFAAYADSWRAAQMYRPNTTARVETSLRCHVLPFLGDRPIGAIRTSELRTWIRGRSEVLAPSSVRTLHQLVVSIFGAAVTDRLINVSPTVGVKLPRPEHEEVFPISAEEVQAVAGGMPERYRAIVIVAAATGMRQGEVLGLSLDRVDFLRRNVRVDRQLLTMPGQAPVLGPPKTPSSARTIPAPQVALEALSRHLEMFPVGEEGFVFTDPAGQPIRRLNLGRMWRQAARQADVDHTFHDLRHFAASTLIAAGSSVKAVQRFLGHTSAKTTLDVYGHLWPDEEDRTRAALDAALSAPVSPACHREAVR